MPSAKRPHLLHKRGRLGEFAAPHAPGGTSGIRAHDHRQHQHHLDSHQERHARDGHEESSSISSSTGSSDPVLHGLLQDVPTRKPKSQLTSTEYALQEIRSRVRAIDERWEEVNVRATNTLDNIKEGTLASLEPGGNRRRSARIPAARKRREKDRKFSLRSGSKTGNHAPPSILDSASSAMAWLDEMGNSGRRISRDERLAFALAESQENLAEASQKFEESQERSAGLLDELRGWLDSFTGTARPEDINPIMVMLPDEGVQSEVVLLMTDCQDAAMMLEQSTKVFTKRLGEIFSQAGELYDSDANSAQKRELALSSAFREKISGLEQDATKVERLLKSLQEERTHLQFRLSSTEQRASALDERNRTDRAQLQTGLEDYRHRVMQLQHVVAGYEEKARRLEQIEREPRLGPVLNKAPKGSPPPVETTQLRKLQADVEKLTAENTDLVKVNKNLNLELVVLRLNEQSGRRIGEPKPKPAVPQTSDPGSSPVEDERQYSDGGNAAVEEELNNTQQELSRAEAALRETKHEKKSLSERVKTLTGELEKEKKRTTVVNNPAPDVFEESLRDALRDLRRGTSDQLSEQNESHRVALSELGGVLNMERKKGKKAAEAAQVEITGLRAELDNAHEELEKQNKKMLRSPLPEETASVVAPTQATPAPPPVDVVDEVPPVTPSTSMKDDDIDESTNDNFTPVDYAELVHRAVSQEEAEMSELRRKAEGAGVAQWHFQKAEKMYSDVVDCCGEGLSSVEHVLRDRAAPTKSEDKEVDEDAAASIQQALALALERAIASANLLLRETLLGRVRACEAEKQLLTEQATAEAEASKAATLDRENRSLVEQLHEKQAHITAAMTELASLRQRSREEVLPVPVEPVLESKAVTPPVARKSHSTKLELVHPVVKRNSEVAEAEMWRRRYEHLAGLLADTTKESRRTTPARVRRSPRPIGTTVSLKRLSVNTRTKREQPTPSISTLRPRAPVVAEAHFPVTDTDIEVGTTGDGRSEPGQISPVSSISLERKDDSGSLPLATSTDDGPSSTRVSTRRDSCDSAMQTEIGLQQNELIDNTPRATSADGGRSTPRDSTRRDSCDSAMQTEIGLQQNGRNDNTPRATSADGGRSTTRVSTRRDSCDSAMQTVFNLQQNEGNDNIQGGTFPDGGQSATRVLTRKNSCDGVTQTAVLDGPQTSEGATQVNLVAPSGINTDGGQTSCVAAAGITQGRVDEVTPPPSGAHAEPDTTVDKTVPSSGHSDGVSSTTPTVTRLETIKGSSKSGRPSLAAAIVKGMPATDATDVLRERAGREEADVIMEGTDIAPFEATTENADDGVAGVDVGQDKSKYNDDDDSTVELGRDARNEKAKEDRADYGNIEDGRAVDGAEKDEDGECIETSEQHGKNKQSIFSDSGEVDTSASAAKSFEETYEKIDEEILLDKLLNNATPSDTFKGDHEQLVLNLLKSRGNGPSPRGETHANEETNETNGDSTGANCSECPLLRRELDARLVQLESLKGQLAAVESDLEDSEHRVYSLSSDNASLKRKLAKHSNMLRRAQSFADEVIHSPSTDEPIAKCARTLKEVFDKVGSPNTEDVVEQGDMRRDGSGTSVTKPMTGADKKEGNRSESVREFRGSQSSNPQSTAAQRSKERRGSTRTSRRVSDNNTRSATGQEASIARAGSSTGARNSLTSNNKRQKRGSTYARRGSLLGKPRSKTKKERRGSIITAAPTAAAPPASEGFARSEKGLLEDGFVASGRGDGIACDGNELGWGSGNPGNVAGTSDIEPLGGDDPEEKGREPRKSAPPGEDKLRAPHNSTPPSSSIISGNDHEINCTEHSAADQKIFAGDHDGQEQEPAKVALVTSPAFVHQADEEQTEPRPWSEGGNEGNVGGDGTLAAECVMPDSLSSRRSEALAAEVDNGEDLMELGTGGDNRAPAAADRREERSSKKSGDTGQDAAGRQPDYTETNTARDNKGGIKRITVANTLEESSASTSGNNGAKLKATTARTAPVEGVLPKEFVPGRKSLIAYAEAAARCKLAIEALEDASFTLSEEGSRAEDSGNDLKDDRGSQEQQMQTLLDIYRDLKAGMMEWGVEAMAALLVEVTKTAAKHGAMSAWLSSTTRTRTGDEGESSGNGGGNSSSEKRRQRVKLLKAQEVVLREVIDALGGWKAAVYFEEGGVNLDVEIGAWPVEDQVSMLCALNDFLRKELDQKGKRHRNVLDDMLARLRAAQAEAEEARSRPQPDVRQEPSSPEESPEETPEEEQPQNIAQEILPHQQMIDHHGTDLTLTDPSDAPDRGEEKFSGDNDGKGDVAEGATIARQESEEPATVEATETDAVEHDCDITEEPAEDEAGEKEEERCNTREDEKVLAPDPMTPAPPQPQEVSPDRSEEAAIPQQPLGNDHHAPADDTKDAEIKKLRAELNTALIALNTAREDLRVEKDRSRQGQARPRKHVDIIKQAEDAERRAKQREEARFNAGYPLAALAAERRAVADLREALTKAVCAVLEACRPPAETSVGGSTATHGGEKYMHNDGSALSLYGLPGSSPQPPTTAVNDARGPPGMLVQMVCSGDDATVHCATTEYRLQKGIAQAGVQGCYNHDEVSSGHGFDPVDRGGSVMSTTAEATAGGGASRAAQLRGPQSTIGQGSEGVDKESRQPQRDLSRVPVTSKFKPPTNIQEALAAAHHAASAVQSFTDSICSIDVGGSGDESGFEAHGAQSANFYSREATGIIEDGRGSMLELSEENPRVDTTATIQIIDALQADASWARSLSTFVRGKLEAEVTGVGQQMLLKEREIEILTEAQRELKNNLRGLKADYVSADAADVIRSLRTTLRGVNRQVRFLEKQLCLAQEASDVEGGAIEVLEGLLRKRDADRELCRALDLKSLEIGMKIKLLETDTGGNTVEVSRRDKREQQALKHLKARLIKRREALAIRKAVVSAELERSLVHGMRAFERVNRTIQRLCNGYTSLPGLLEWSRTAAARMEGGARYVECDGVDTSDHPPSDSENSEGEHLKGLGRRATGTTSRPQKSSIQQSPQRDGSENKSTEMTFERKPFSDPRRHVSYSPTNRGSDARTSTIAASSGSSRAPTATQFWYPSSDSRFDLPKMLSNGGKGESCDAKCLRRRLKTAGHCTERGNNHRGKGGGSGGVLCDGEYESSAMRSCWSGITKTASKISNKQSDFSSLGDGDQTISNNSSVSSLLREEMAFRRQNGGFHRSLEEGRGSANSRSVPALVPLNNVGLPVRMRQQPRRTRELM